MGNSVTALVFVVFINVLLFIAQASMISINPEGTIIYHCDKSMLAQFGDCQTLNTDDVTSKLPSNTGSISPTTGNLFTDTFTAVKNWFLSIPGINYLYAIIKAPYTLIVMMGLPAAFAFAIGTFWYAISLYVVIRTFVGGD